ncbi:MAG TPA: ATP-binding protein [Tepidisphaeraceae bacterium]|nr:ATP-binding protein [Tepidisphaeraceae bacterium]
MSDNPSTAAAKDEAQLARQFVAAQEQLEYLRDQLTESQRLATIGTIAAVIAHEFNNLLTPVVSYSQFALASAESDKPDMALIKKALSKSFQGSTKAGKICASMLALARGESSPAEVSVQQLIDEVLLVLARDPQKDGIALRVRVEPDLLVNGDPVQLEQVLLNLLINARQAMLGSRGGSLTIKASAEGSEVKIQVIDTGPGIPEQLLGKIFEPFFTTKCAGRRGEAKGTGLGLAICKEIVEHHAGRIDVSSELGKGTTFTIHLPMAGR